MIVSTFFVTRFLSHCCRRLTNDKLVLAARRDELANNRGFGARKCKMYLWRNDDVDRALWCGDPAAVASELETTGIPRAEAGVRFAGVLLAVAARIEAAGAVVADVCDSAGDVYIGIEGTAQLQGFMPLLDDLLAICRGERLNLDVVIE